MLKVLKIILIFGISNSLDAVQVISQEGSIYSGTLEYLDSEKVAIKDKKRKSSVHLSKPQIFRLVIEGDEFEEILSSDDSILSGLGKIGRYWKILNRDTKKKTLSFLEKELSRLPEFETHAFLENILSKVRNGQEAGEINLLLAQLEVNMELFDRAAVRLKDYALPRTIFNLPTKFCYLQSKVSFYLDDSKEALSWALLPLSRFPAVGEKKLDPAYRSWITFLRETIHIEP